MEIVLSRKRAKVVREVAGPFAMPHSSLSMNPSLPLKEFGDETWPNNCAAEAADAVEGIGQAVSTYMEARGLSIALKTSQSAQL